MTNVWEKFNKAIDTEGLKKDVESAKDGQKEFKEVPNGTYEVEIEKLELTTSKKGAPMVSCWMKIINGEFENNRLFMNQVITQGFQIHLANEFLRSLDSGVEIEFDDYVQYGNLIMDVHEAIDGQLEYAVEYGENKGFNTFKITDVFEK